MNEDSESIYLDAILNEKSKYVKDVLIKNKIKKVRYPIIIPFMNSYIILKRGLFRIAYFVYAVYNLRENILSFYLIKSNTKTFDTIELFSYKPFKCDSYSENMEILRVYFKLKEFLDEIKRDRKRDRNFIFRNLFRRK